MSGNLILAKPIHCQIPSSEESKKNNFRKSTESKNLGYLLCKARSIEEVKKWAEACPVLEDPNGATEIREISHSLEKEKVDLDYLIE
jgi:hypothetical protein